MRKKVFGKQLSRNRRSRTALFRALMKSMIVKGSIKTTKAKAQAVVGELDKLINLSRDSSIVARREVLARLGNDKDATELLFTKYQALAKSRNSGFTTWSSLGPRKGDAAPMVSISWVEVAAKVTNDENVSNKGKTD